MWKLKKNIVNIGKLIILISIFLWNVYYICFFWYKLMSQTFRLIIYQSNNLWNETIRLSNFWFRHTFLIYLNVVRDSKMVADPVVCRQISDEYISKKNPALSDRYSSGYSVCIYLYRTTLLYTVDKFHGITKVLNTQHGSYINLNLWTLELPHII